MNLPSKDIEWWQRYRNETPTFDLTPVEKPDFSPFLIHMTSKNSLVKILNGESKPDGIVIPKKNGYLKAVKPSFDGQARYYNSEVVCFTETPIFALDFFRYRSLRRCIDDQQFGIGFSKSALIKYRNVRPVIYLDTETNKQILSFCNKIIDGTYKVQDQNGDAIDKIELFSKIKPLLFPLLQDRPLQGFMWEREWRYTDNQGMIFPHRIIKIICCPSSEKEQIIDILGDQSDKIEIVENWREYDEVTNYLKQRQRKSNTKQLNTISQIKDFGVLEDFKNQNDRTLNTLEAYYGVFKETVTSLEGRNINQMIDDMKQKSKEIEEQINAVLDEIKKKEEQAKAKK